MVVVVVVVVVSLTETGNDNSRLKYVGLWGEEDQS
jgi:hypothetical protein